MSLTKEVQSGRVEVLFDKTVLVSDVRREEIDESKPNKKPRILNSMAVISPKTLGLPDGQKKLDYLMISNSSNSLIYLDIQFERLVIDRCTKLDIYSSIEKSRGSEIVEVFNSKSIQFLRPSAPKLMAATLSYSVTMSYNGDAIKYNTDKTTDFLKVVDFSMDMKEMDNDGLQAVTELVDRARLASCASNLVGVELLDESMEAKTLIIPPYTTVELNTVPWLVHGNNKMI